MAPRKPPLRAVAAGETAPAKPKTLLEAVEAGDYLAELRATHERIAKAVASPSTIPRDLAALTRRQLEISEKIQAIVTAAKREGGSAGLAADESLDAASL